jgi:endoglucanase
MTMRAFYGQRCGCKVDLGGGYRHGRCHEKGEFHPSSGRSGKARTAGGWHDAGDYGRYVVNSGLSTGTLLWAWELYPETLRGLRLGIPESRGKTPDFLAEVQWNLEWMLSMQDETDGGVWQKQTSERFCGFIMPEKDELTSFVIGSGTAPYKTTAATADLAAVAAIAARTYAPFDRAFAQRCLGAARRAWSWAVAHPDLAFRNPPGVTTGEYGDPTLADELLWASAELWRTTGEAQFEEQFLASMRPRLPELRIGTPGWGNLTSFACWSYAVAERAGATEVKERVRAVTHDAADELVRRSATSGYGHTLELREFGWGSNSVAANQSLLLAIADRFEPRPELREAALNNLHYLLGRNCHGVSWVTQVGTRPFLHPHHRPSAADGIPAPWPGLLSGGPNAHPADEVARRLPAAAPMRMWVDDERAYSMNEVAINWNAPLVFALAAANHTRT